LPFWWVIPRCRSSVHSSGRGVDFGRIEHAKVAVPRRLEDAETAELKRQITRLVAAADTTLTDLYGVGPLVAVRVRERHRAVASLLRPHRPAPVQPRQEPPAQRSLYTIALTQIRGDTEGRAHYERKRAAGKTKREALRCLKRRLSDIVFTTMRHDAAGTDASSDQARRRSGQCWSEWVRSTQMRPD
jgi:transposase